jgi:hypothetical protein
MTRTMEPIIVFTLGIMIVCAVLCTTCLVRMAFFDDAPTATLKIQHSDLRD